MSRPFCVDIFYFFELVKPRLRNFPNKSLRWWTSNDLCSLPYVRFYSVHLLSFIWRDSTNKNDFRFKSIVKPFSIQHFRDVTTAISIWTEIFLKQLCFKWEFCESPKSWYYRSRGDDPQNLKTCDKKILKNKYKWIQMY